MRRNGRHPTSRRRFRPVTGHSDGFRPLSLVPPLPDRAADGSGGDPGADGASGGEATADQVVDGVVISDAAVAESVLQAMSAVDESPPELEPGLTPEQTRVRNQEIEAWRIERLRQSDTGPVRRLDGWTAPPGAPRDRLRLPVEPVVRTRWARPGSPEEWRREIVKRSADDLAEQWGGPDRLDQLDADPLPDEPFDWSAVPVVHRARVEQILASVDDACDALFDIEHRTASRRLLARVAHSPEVVNRRGKPETVAGTIVWTIASFNRRTGRKRRPGIVPASWIADHLGLSSGSAFAQRIDDVCTAAGIDLFRARREPVDEPDLTTAWRRHNVIRLRDRYREELS